MFKVKYDRRHNVRCVPRKNRVETVDIDTSATTAQNSTAYLILVALVQ